MSDLKCMDFEAEFILMTASSMRSVHVGKTSVDNFLVIVGVL